MSNDSHLSRASITQTRLINVGRLNESIFYCSQITFPLFSDVGRLGGGAGGRSSIKPARTKMILYYIRRKLIWGIDNVTRDNPPAECDRTASGGRGRGRRVPAIQFELSLVHRSTSVPPEERAQIGSSITNNAFDAR